MDLLVVRHAIAEERDAFAQTGKNDSKRPLTPEGRRKFRRAARGLRKTVDSIDVLATSTLVRAVETAEILQATYGMDGTERLDELAPDADPASLLPWLRRRRRHPVVAIVGHEPHLSQLIAYLLFGKSRSCVELKKGGASLLALGTTPDAGRADLRWLLTAGQLRQL